MLLHFCRSIRANGICFFLILLLAAPLFSAPLFAQYESQNIAERLKAVEAKLEQVEKKQERILENQQKNQEQILEELKTLRIWVRRQ